MTIDSIRIIVTENYSTNGLFSLRYNCRALTGHNVFEIIFLGTSAAAPSAKRGLSASIVSHDEFRFLVDCGEGTQRQILKAGAGFKRLNRILLTHGHLDHILGLGGLMSTFLRWEAIDELEIYGGHSALARVHDLLYGVVLRGKKPHVKCRGPYRAGCRYQRPGVP